MYTHGLNVKVAASRSILLYFFWCAFIFWDFWQDYTNSVAKVVFEQFVKLFTHIFVIKMADDDIWGLRISVMGNSDGNNDEVFFGFTLQKVVKGEESDTDLDIFAKKWRFFYSILRRKTTPHSLVFQVHLCKGFCFSRFHQGLAMQ